MTMIWIKNNCDSAEDIALAVCLSEAEVHQLVTEYNQWRWQQEGVKKNKENRQSIFSNSFRLASLTLDSVQKLLFRLSFPLSL